MTKKFFPERKKNLTAIDEKAKNVLSKSLLFYLKQKPNLSDSNPVNY